MLEHLPNALTLVRLLLAVPMGMLILQEQFATALAVGFAAGLTDLLDGYFARRLQAFSRFGAALDPIADKMLITVSFLSFAYVGLVPWYLAAIVICRDGIIVIGAACYYKLIGPIEFAATTLSKCNMFVQICFCALVLFNEVVVGIPPAVMLVSSIVVLGIAIASGLDYVWSWSRKALQTKQEAQR